VTFVDRQFYEAAFNTPFFELPAMSVGPKMRSVYPSSASPAIARSLI